MRLVAVSQRVDAVPGRDERRDALDQRLVAFLLASGCLPVPVPNGMCAPMAGEPQGDDALRAWLQAVSPAAVVLSGGNDIGQCPARDATELALLAHARDRRLPVLGICRGMQMMAHWAGAGLRRVPGHVRVRHRLSGHITGEVNSYHEQALAACPQGFAVLARSEDGGIEAIGHDTLPWEGWMWHPERETGFAPADLQRARALLGGLAA